MLGFVTKVHQPPCAASDGVSSEVMKSPVVGTSQKIAISASTMWTGVRLRKRMIRAERRVSGSTGVSTVVSTAVSTVAISSCPPGSAGR